MDEVYAHLEAKGDGVSKRLQPPDGGWGYVVCLGVGFTFMFGFGSSNAFGILFNNFFLEQGSASGLPLVIGIYNGSLSIAGNVLMCHVLLAVWNWLRVFIFVLHARFLSGIALKRYSFRQVGLVGAALFVLGDVLTIFVAKTYQLAFTFGVIRGAGFGVMIPVSFTAFNCYFTKKRTAMMSANQTMSSTASITFPLLVTYLLAEYGFRWTLALIMAVDLHLLFAMLVMHPVEWHMVDLTTTDVQTAPSTNNDITCQERKRKDTSEDYTIQMLGGGDVTDTRAAATARNESIQKSIIKIVYHNVELDLLKDPRFVSTLVGLGFAFVSDVTYLAMEPMLLFSYNYTKMEVAKCVMIGAIADLVARFSLAVFTYFHNVDSKTIFFVGTCVTTVLRVALVMWDNLTYITTITAISGLVRCSVQVMFPLVLVAAAPDRFPAALALHILFSGCLMLIADPLIGIIYDVTGSYVYCFFAMSFCCLICVVLWAVEYIIYRTHRTAK